MRYYIYLTNTTLFGNSGNDVLDGGTGTDTMDGGYDNDVYYVDNTGDVVSELENYGTDRVFASVSFSLSANIEHLTLTGQDALTGHGNTLDNTLVASGEGGTLYGYDGNDRLFAGNLVFNGNFDDGFAFWSRSGNVLTNNSAGSTDGLISSAAVFSAGNSPNTGVIWQTITTTPGESYDLFLEALDQNT